MSIIDSPRKGQALLTLPLLLLFFAPIVSAQDADEPGDPEPITEPDGFAVRPSDSPLMRPPTDLITESIMPYEGPPGPPIADPTATITFDLSSGRSFVQPSPDPAQGPPGSELLTTEAFAGLALPVASYYDFPGQESVIGFDDRVRVTATGTYPWRTVVRLAVKWTASTGGACSGTMLSAYHVLTAGHCVFDYGGTNDWAYSIQVFPGLDDDETPYNYAWGTRYHSYTGWTNSGQTEHDWAVIALDRSVGSFTGWMGRQTADSTNGIYTGILNVAGYPGTPNGNTTCPTWANCQFFDSDSGHSASNDNHWYWMDTSGGMSGGPVWRYISATGSRYVLTTHTCGTGGCGIASNGVNHGTRLNQDKYDRIPTWISDDSDITPNDRADLIDDGQTYSGFTPTSVYNGQSFSAWSDVRNVGTAPSGGFYVSYYASTNTTISTADYLIGNDYMSSINPFTWADSGVNLGFPSGIPDGTYYVGWIIDRFDDVSEFVENNNTAYKTAYQLSVCNIATTPTLLSPANGAQTEDQTPFLDWSTVNEAGSYRVQVDDDSNFSSPVINLTTSSSHHTPSSNLAFGTYYWRVRADKACGTLGYWTSIRFFVVNETPIFADGFESGNLSAWSSSTGG